MLTIIITRSSLKFLLLNNVLFAQKTVYERIRCLLALSFQIFLILVNKKNNYVELNVLLSRVQQTHVPFLHFFHKYLFNVIKSIK